MILPRQARKNIGKALEKGPFCCRMPTHLIPVAGLMLVVVAAIYVFAGGSSVPAKDADIESPSLGGRPRPVRRLQQRFVVASFYIVRLIACCPLAH